METTFLKTLYVSFLMEVDSRRVRIVGVTAHPDRPWVGPAGEEPHDEGWARARPVLIRDRDAKFTASFNEAFRTEGARVSKTPVLAPRANAYAERFVRTIRTELLDQTLVLGPRHLLAMLCDYETHYNEHRPHRGIELDGPERLDADITVVPLNQIRRTKVLAG